MAGPSDGPLVVWPLMGVSLFFIIPGLCAYRGIWRAWAWHSPGSKYAAFGAAWLGLAALACSFVPLLDHGSNAARLGGSVAICVMVVGLVVAVLAPFWMWKPLQPRWFKYWQEAGRPVVPAGKRLPGWYVPVLSARASEGYKPTDLRKGEGTLVTSESGRSADLPSVRDEETGAGIGYPAGWEQIVVNGTALTLAWPEKKISAGVFRPNLTVTVEPAPPEADVLPAVSLALVKLLQEQIKSLHLVSFNSVKFEGGNEGREIVSIYREPPFAVQLTQWVTVVDGIVTLVSASCGIEQVDGLRKTFDYCIALFEHATSLPAGTSPTIKSAVAELDRQILVQGRRVEELRGISSAQPYRGHGPRVGLEGWALLVDAYRVPLDVAGLGELIRPQAQVLIAHGLLNERGALSDIGRPIAETLRSPILSFSVEATLAGQNHTLQIAVSADRAVVLASDAPALQARGDIPSGITLEVIEPVWVAGLIASWTELAPAWNMGPISVDLAQSLFLARVNNPDTPPPDDADPALRAMWAEPWMLWNLRLDRPNDEAHRLGSTTAERELSVLNTGRRGCFLISSSSSGEADGPTVTLQAAPSSVVWKRLRKTVDQALRAPA